MLLKIEKYESEGNTMWISTLRNWLPKAAYEISQDAVYGGEPSWKTILFNLDLPKCFIFGEKSLPDEDYDELQCKHEDIIIVENAGHSMAWENSADLAFTIKNCIMR